MRVTFKRYAILMQYSTTVNVADSRPRLGELAGATGLPATRMAVGLDHMGLLLARIVLEWRLEVERHRGRERDRSHRRELAEHVSAIDLLAHLADKQTEAQVIAAIEELFRMLFPPAIMHYLQIADGRPVLGPDIPADLRAASERLEASYAWTPSGRGFLLRIARAGKPGGNRQGKSAGRRIWR